MISITGVLNLVIIMDQAIKIIFLNKKTSARSRLENDGIVSSQMIAYVGCDWRHRQVLSSGFFLKSIQRSMKTKKLRRKQHHVIDLKIKKKLSKRIAIVFDPLHYLPPLSAPHTSAWYARFGLCQPLFNINNCQRPGVILHDRNILYALWK